MIIKIIYILLLCLLKVATDKIIDESSNNKINDGVRKPNVVGGEEVKPAFKYPWIVSLQWKGSHVCGGTMIKNNLVLTAAHCSTGNQNDFSVVIHRHNLSKTMKEEKSQSFKILKRYVHESYNTITNFNDAAIWKLSGKYEGDFEPILFDNGEGSIAGDSVFGIGWGRLKVDGPLSNVLMEVEMPVTEPKKCIDIMKEQGYTISSDIQVCAGLPEGGKDTCQGDSGGPLISKKGGKMMLVGITSFGISCALPNLPGIYTKVKGIVPWIEGKIKEAESFNDNEEVESIEDKNEMKLTKVSYNQANPNPTMINHSPIPSKREINDNFYNIYNNNNGNNNSNYY